MNFLRGFKNRFGGVYVGWDPREELAYSVCAHSIQRRAGRKVKVSPLKQHELRTAGLYWREPDKLASTEFTFTRFLVPALSKYKGFSIFCDGDFLFLSDIGELMDLFDSRYAVQVVQHDYQPTAATKKAGFTQTVYPRKNWSSLVIWNNAHPKNRLLTPAEVNTREPAYLHRFQWLDDEDIGALPIEWNWLVGWYDEQEEGTKPKALHFTEGGPWLEQHRDNPYVPSWDRELADFLAVEYTAKHGVREFKGKTWKKHLPLFQSVVPRSGELRVLDFGCGPLGGIGSAMQNVISYDPFVAAYAADPWGQRVDAIFSADVMEHMAIHQLDDFLGKIRERGIGHVFLVVSLRKATKQFSDGTNVHVTVRDREWWLETFARRLPAHRARILTEEPGEEMVVLLSLEQAAHEAVA